MKIRECYHDANGLINYINIYEDLSYLPAFLPPLCTKIFEAISGLRQYNSGILGMYF